MANTIETYTGKINEYVDWVTGKDTLTDQDVTGGLPVSGGSIRNLLQDKLKKPLYMYEDVENGLYRMFSSEESKNLFISDPQAYANLEIFNFVRPSDYELSTDISLNPRYLISGDSTQTAGILAYSGALSTPAAFGPRAPAFGPACPPLSDSLRSSLPGPAPTRMAASN